MNDSLAIWVSNSASPWFYALVLTFSAATIVAFIISMVLSLGTSGIHPQDISKKYRNVSEKMVTGMVVVAVVFFILNILAGAVLGFAMTKNDEKNAADMITWADQNYSIFLSEDDADTLVRTERTGEYMKVQDKDGDVVLARLIPNDTRAGATLEFFQKTSK